jgi:hypothetical protein
MSSLWVDFAAIKGSVDIEQVLEHYRVRLKRVRKDYLRGLCPLPTHGSEQSRASFGVDTGRNVWACHSASCSQARHGKVGGNILDLVACMEACSIREAALRLRAWSDTSRETGLPDQLVSSVDRPIVTSLKNQSKAIEKTSRLAGQRLIDRSNHFTRLNLLVRFDIHTARGNDWPVNQKETGSAVARRNFPGCPSLCGRSGILTWNSEGSSGKPPPGSEPATMADRDSCGNAWFFQFTMNAANWWHMRAG